MYGSTSPPQPPVRNLCNNASGVLLTAGPLSSPPNEHNRQRKVDIFHSIPVPPRKILKETTIAKDASLYSFSTMKPDTL
jgi:hypothetical protein